MTAEALEYSVHLRRPHPMHEQLLNSPAKRIVIRHPRDSVMRITDRAPPLRPRVSSPRGLPLRVLSAAPTARGRVFWQVAIHPPGCSRALESLRVCLQALCVPLGPAPIVHGTACLQARKLVQDVIDESPPEGSVFVLFRRPDMLLEVLYALVYAPHRCPPLPAFVSRASSRLSKRATSSSCSLAARP